jgi:hypothetical protein
MKTQYDWNSYPKWVRYVAVDDTLELWGYSRKPQMNRGYWTTIYRPKHRMIRLGLVYVPDWRTSLERRPKAIAPCE